MKSGKWSGKTASGSGVVRNVGLGLLASADCPRGGIGLLKEEG